MSLLRDQIAEANPEAILFDGLDDALIGVGRQWGSEPLAIYSAEKIIEVLAEEFGSHEQAWEWYGHNVECLYAGPNTPIIVDFPPEP